MGYEQFGDYLEKQKESFSIKFDEIEEIIGRKLPDSALKHVEWWSNSDSHPLMKIALSENWKSRKLNLNLKEIEFYKTSESSLLKFLKNNPTMFQNYQAVVIKTLLENDVNDNYSTSTFRQAAIRVLQQNGKPLHYKEITKRALDQKLIGTSGQTPELSLLRDMTEDIRLNPKNAIFRKINEGEYGLSDFTTKSRFSATINEIKNKIVELNFDRKDFEINSGWASVKEALGNNNIISINGENVKLNDENISDVEKTECLKICGQKIAGFHVTKLMKEDNQYWFIQAGREDEQKIKLEKWRKGDYVAVDYYDDCDFDLSGMTRNEIDTKTGGKKVQELFNISQIKQGDFIAVVKGNKTVEEFAIATSDYYFVVSDTERDKHRVNVEYLNFGTTKFGKNWNAAIMQDTSGKIKNFLLGEKEPKYFLLRHNVKGPWKDDPGKKYHVGRESDGRMGKRVRQILDTGIGTKTVWYSTSKSKGGFYFWGYGTVTGIEEEKKDTDWYLTYNDFKFFEGDVDVQGRKLKRATESVNQQLQELQNDKEWKMNWQLSINPIPKKIYEEITGDRSTMSTSPKQDNGVDPRTIEILKRKMNIVLYGPPGTGKTYNAKKIAEKLISTNTPDAALCFPTDQGIDKITRFQKFLKDQDNKLVWGVGWLGAGQLNAADFPINGFIYYRQEIIAIARITKITSHDETTKEEQKLRPDNQEWKFYLHMDKLELCKPFSHKKLKLIDKTKPMPEVVQQRVYVEDYTKFRNQVTFHQSYGYEEFIEGIRPKSTKNGGITYPVEPGTFKKICDTARGSQNKFVLIIDEINRGNISKIFGELITIIENDKRGEPVILAYSGDSFSVPENVYVIGTMNTADQSIKFLDAALKRRFSSIELMPDPSILKDGMPGLSQLLIEINKRIVEKRTRDNQIGHSYFMNKEKAITDIEELQFVFATEIIPLLRDYFYDNEDDLQHVLGEQFIDWDEGSANVKDDWQNDKNKFRDAIKAAYNVKI